MKYCSVCKAGLDKTIRCSACKCIIYCSEKCQRLDRSYHKRFCKNFGELWKSEGPRFEKLGEPLSSKMLEFIISVDSHLAKANVKKLAGKSLVINGNMTKTDGFQFKISLLEKSLDIFSESELEKIHVIPLLYENGVVMNIYKLRTDIAGQDELLHIVRANAPQQK